MAMAIVTILYLTPMYTFYLLWPLTHILIDSIVRFGQLLPFCCTLFYVSLGMAKAMVAMLFFMPMCAIKL